MADIMVSSWLLRLIITFQAYMDTDMSKNSGSQSTPANSEEKLSPEAKTIKVKKGIWRTYDATDGLPGEAKRLLQDRWGYLWIGTNAGLCRYDGTEFITYTTSDGLIGNGVKALCEDNQGKLWIGTVDGLSCLDDKRFTNYTTEYGLPDNDTAALCTDNQGKLWIGTPQGLSCLDDKRFTNYTTVDGLIDDKVVALCPGIQGGVWIGTRSGISRFDDGQFVTLTTDISVAPGPTMCEDGYGRLWIATGDQCKGVHCFDGQQFKTYTYGDGLVDKQNFTFTAYEDSQGRMWFGAWLGISCFDGSRFIKLREAGNIGGTFDIIEGREGQMWLAHGEACVLSCYDAETVSLLSDWSAGWTSTQDKKGRIWCGVGNVIGIYPDSELSEIERRSLSFTMGGIYLMVDSRDRLWISPYRDGVYCYDSTDAAWEAADGNELPSPRHFGVSDNLTDRSYIIPLLEMEDGTIWFSFLAAARLSRFDPEQMPDGEPLESIDTKDKVRCLVRDKLGRLWMGGMGHIGLSCWDGSELTTYTQENGLPSDHVMSLLEDDAGQIWIGTTHGLCCFDGEQIVAYGKEHDLRDLYHWQSCKDTSGQLWFSTRCGIYRYDGEHFQWLTEDDVLPGNRVVASLPQPDSSMIICTSKGVMRYRHTATLPPLVGIREVSADKVYQYPEELELTTVEADFITISYHGLSLATHRMRYSYILEGYDEEWKETWDTQARYENLSVGEYTFKVIAINRDLVTSGTPATLRLRIVTDPRDSRITALQAEVNHLRREVGARYDFQDIIGESAAIREVKMRMERAIESGLNLVVLITGETGTGKELVANAIHFNSSRKDELMVPYNCAAIPRELGASTFFGHKKGAFTGAYEDKIGLFEAAQGGTLMLDEIGDIPLDVQSGLLRVLEDRRIQRVGEDNFQHVQHVDVQIIAITNHNLEKEVEAGRFREDLYHRLNEFRIHLPSLRERLADVPLLAEHFLRRYSEESSREIDGFAPDVLEILQSYLWPGNVRELRRTIHLAADYAVYEGMSIIQPHHFPSQITSGRPEMQDIVSRHLSYRESLDLFSRHLIEDALRKSGGNRAEAARILGMHRPSLVQVIKRLGIKIDK
ncbi:sigma 54-interacting transcriptional regulator [Candidatus Poribacteria bacterium]